jgi:hypothetical protein
MGFHQEERTPDASLSAGRQDGRVAPGDGAPPAFTTVPGAPDLRVYWPRVEKDRGEVERLLRGLDDGCESQLHLLRHFTGVPDEYRRGLIGKTFVREDRAKGRSYPVTINNETIDRALACWGSKFEPAAFAHPLALIELVRGAALAREDLVFFDEGFCHKTYLIHDAGVPVGRQGLVPVAALSPEEAARAERQMRGRLGGDDFFVRVVPGGRGPVTTKLSALIGVIDGKACIFTAHPGEPAPDFPKDSQSPAEQEYNRHFWETHAFVS